MGKKWERFYAPMLPDNGELWINGQEAHHMLHVKRVGLGERLLLFDGKGREAVGRVVETQRDRARVAIDGVDEVNREARIAITLAFSVPKGKKSEFLVQKCCELGVRKLIPLECERSAVKLVPEGSRKVEKWRSVAVEASKQCGRTYITEIADVLSFSRLMNSADAYSQKLFASTDPEAVALSEVVRDNEDPGNILCVIGPEGGFSNKETDAATHAGFTPVSLGPSVLRTETASVAIVSMLLYAYSN
ncbi:MAG: 16S rRNA (uracil(1498)-N(3))-methyltransferase [Candidatus Brocadiales bacterium]